MTIDKDISQAIVFAFEHPENKVIPHGTREEQQSPLVFQRLDVSQKWVFFLKSRSFVQVKTQFTMNSADDVDISMVKTVSVSMTRIMNLGRSAAK